MGRAIALVLTRQGADVAIGDIDLDYAEDTAALIRDSGRRAMTLKLDVSSRSAAKQTVDQIVDEWGAIDILVNNAGVVSAEGQNGETVTTEEEWEFVLGVNLNGVVNCTDAVLPHMSNARYGKIINIALTAGKSGDPPPAQPITVKPGEQVRLGGSAYAASKAAVIRHTQIVASSAAPFNINVNTP